MSRGEKWDEKLGYAPGETEELVFNSKFGTEAQLGQVTTEDHWVNIGRELNLSTKDLAQFRNDFWAGDQFDFGMIDWIRTWRDRYQTAIISNAFDDLRGVLTEEFGVGDAFDHIVVSSELGVMKPAAEIYTHTLDLLDCPPQAAVFIDDNAGNIKGAEALGIRGILFTPALDLNVVLPLEES